MEILEIIGFEPQTNVKIPLFTMSVSAGYPVPVDNDIAQAVDLNEFLIEHPIATFFARVKGDSLKEFGVNDNDILIVDTALEPEDGKLVVVSINQELTVKTYRVINNNILLESQGTRFLPMKIAPYMEFRLIGVVTRAIHTL